MTMPVAQHRADFPTREHGEKTSDRRACLQICKFALVQLLDLRRLRAGFPGQSFYCGFVRYSLGGRSVGRLHSKLHLNHHDLFYHSGNSKARYRFAMSSTRELMQR